MKTAAFLTFTGLVLTMFGVGGIENSITDSELLAGVAVSVVGLGIMGSAVLMMQNLDNQT